MTSIPFNIPINNDNILEVDEDFTLTIMHSILPNGVTRGSIGQAAVTIVDDDGETFMYTLYQNHNVTQTSDLICDRILENCRYTHKSTFVIKRI